jgi:uncharacterized protein (DUF433 family)
MFWYRGDMEQKTLPGLSKYAFRSDGEVISYWKDQPTILKGGTDKDGYRKFVLIDDMGGRRYVRRASLICAAFHGPRPKGHEVRHIDGSRQNDAPLNLAWATHRENCADKATHGTSQRGKRNGNAKITETQAKRVLERLAAGDSVSQIAKDLGVSRSAIYGIKDRRTWAWLPKPQHFAQDLE